MLINYKSVNLCYSYVNHYVLVYITFYCLYEFLEDMFTGCSF